MAHINHTVGADLISWDHEDGVCKLIRIPRREIDEGSHEADAWDLLWIEASSAVRRVDIRLDKAYDRFDFSDTEIRDQIAEFIWTGPYEAAVILREYLKTYTIACSGSYLLALLPDGEDIEAKVRAEAERAGTSDELDLDDLTIKTDLVLTNDENLARAHKVFYSGSGTGHLTDERGKHYEYAIHLNHAEMTTEQVLAWLKSRGQ